MNELHVNEDKPNPPSLLTSDPVQDLNFNHIFNIISFFNYNFIFS